MHIYTVRCGRVQKVHERYYVWNCFSDKFGMLYTCAVIDIFDGCSNGFRLRKYGTFSWTGQKIYGKYLVVNQNNNTYIYIVSIGIFSIHSPLRANQYRHATF